VIVARPILALVLGGALASATGPVYKQTVMMRCLVEQKLGFAYSVGELPAIPLRQIPRIRDGVVTGAIVFQSFPLYPGKKVFGSGELVFTRSPAGARADATHLAERFSFEYDRSWVDANVVVLWSTRSRSPLARPAIRRCFRASRTA
jgi:hypothetical protein